ncbi:hypothetical protein, partial [Tateyamaria sp. syn59]|uniref:hypothetical protein n=1 Tax=Tateyamaria sp. syn59 TaxID=2576942 RepID=UPI001CB9CD2B
AILISLKNSQLSVEINGLNCHKNTPRQVSSNLARKKLTTIHFIFAPFSAPSPYVYHFLTTHQRRNQRVIAQFTQI